jgi:hypothetical protein
VRHKTARAQASAPVEEASAPGAAEEAEQAADRAIASLRAPIRPSSIPAGEVNWLEAQLEMNTDIGTAKGEALLATANSYVAETRAKNEYGIFLALENMLEDVYRKTIIVFNSILMKTWAEVTTRTIKSFLKVGALDVVATFQSMYSHWEKKTERLDLYKAGEDMDQRALLIDMFGKNLSLDAALGLLAQLDALCSGVKWSAHAEMTHRLLRCLKITPESRIVFNNFYRLPVTEFTASTYEDAVASLRQIGAEFGHPLERNGEKVTISLSAVGGSSRARGGEAQAHHLLRLRRVRPLR